MTMMYKHPHADTLREMVAAMDKGPSRTAIGNRLELLLGIYERRGRFTRYNIGADGWRWFLEIRRKRRKKLVSVEMQQVLTLLQLDQLVRGPRKPNASAVAWARKREALRNTITQVVPAGFVANPGEPLADSVMWWWLHIWHQHVRKPAGAAPDAKLQRVIELVLRMRDDSMLDNMALDMVDMLAGPLEKVPVQLAA